MLVITDTTGVTVKRVIQDSDHVRLGVTLMTLWVDGKKRRQKTLSKPSVEYTINELSDALRELEYLAGLG